jgi:6-phosphogluconolactonase
MLTEHRCESLPALHQALLHWSQELLQRALRDELQDRLQDGLAPQDRQPPQHQKPISVLLSGGNTPLPYYRELAQAVLPWDRIYLALVDERWVDRDDALSNERAIRAAFAANPAALQNFTGMKGAAGSATTGTEACNMRYSQLPWPPTLGVLGLGADGHTASLFPQAEGLEAALNAPQFCVPINARPTEVTGSCTERMTMSLEALLQSRHIALVFTGQQKWQVYQIARQHEDTRLPVSLVLQRAKSLDVFWCP